MEQFFFREMNCTGIWALMLRAKWSRRYFDVNTIEVTAQGNVVGAIGLSSLLAPRYPCVLMLGEEVLQFGREVKQGAQKLSQDG